LDAQQLEASNSVSRVAIVTDSASDLSPDRAAAAGITVIPLIVSFGDQSFKAGTELPTPAFWDRMLAPEAPFPTTAACSPGDVRDVYERCFAEGAEAVISIHVAHTLSGTLKSVVVARDMLPDREIHVVDSMGASMVEGVLAEMAVRLAAEGLPASAIVGILRERIEDIRVMVALDTLEYLKKGGRISGAQAAIGTLLAVKPIIEIRDGLVETVEKVRTKGKARARMLDLLCVRPIEQLVILHTMTPDVEAFVDEFVRRIPGGIDPEKVSIELVGPSVGPHLGPGCVGAVVLYARD
jgi:DegV family protein with EDD domain